MKRSELLTVLSFLSLLPSYLAIPSQSSSIPNSKILPGPGAPQDPSKSLDQASNLTSFYRHYVSDTSIALDFYTYPSMSIIGSKDVLMCVVEGLSKIFGHMATEPVPRLSTFYYQRNAFIHIQDYNPTPGREHTYGDMAATLRGVGEWMTLQDYFRALEFQIWSITATDSLKIGSGGVGGGARAASPGGGGGTGPGVSTS